MAKDRARPFSKKHRKYWLTVTGGMLLIGAINVGIGMCAYQPGPDQVERIDPLKREGMSLGELPTAVMRAFTKAYPQHVPQSAHKLADGTYELTFQDKGVERRARFSADGATAP